VKLPDLFQALRRSVSRYDVEFAKARTRQPALAPYKDALAALDALQGARLPAEQRVALLGALLDEQQTHAHALWHAMLPVACAPMLAALRRRVRPQRDEDLDESVLVAFFEAVAAMPPARGLSCPIFALRRATARPFFQAARAARAGRKALEVLILDDDDDNETGRAKMQVPHPDGDAAAVHEGRALQAAAEKWADGDEELLDMMLETAGGGSTLREFVDARYASAPAETRNANYWRLLRARRRLEAELDALTT